jgi:hypothetical protein
MGDMGMFTTKLNNLVVPVLGIIIASAESALAAFPVPAPITGADLPVITAAVPAPIIGAGLPVLAVLGGGYWLIKKLRERR